MPIIRARGEQPTVQLRFRVSAELAERLERIREEVEAQGYELPVGELVGRALDRVASKAEQDLSALRAKRDGAGRTSSGTQVSESPSPDPADGRVA